MLSRRGMLESTRKERGVRDRSQAAFVHINNTSEVSTVLKMKEGVHVGGWSLTFKQPPWRLTLNASHMIRRTRYLTCGPRGTCSARGDDSLVSQ